MPGGGAPVPLGGVDNALRFVIRLASHVEVKTMEGRNMQALSAGAREACLKTVAWLKAHPDAWGNESLAYTVRLNAGGAVAAVHEVRAALGTESLTKWGWGRTAGEVARELEALAGAGT